MTTISGPHSVGFWFCNTVRGDQDFFGHLFKSPDGQRYIFEYRFHYLKTGVKNWYKWEMATSHMSDVTVRIDYLFKLLPQLGLTPSGEVHSVVRKAGQSESDFSREVLSQPWCKVVGVYPPGPTTPQ